MSRSLLTQGSRHLPPCLIFNVRQKKMKDRHPCEDWQVGEGRFIRTPSYENYGHVALRVRLDPYLHQDRIEFAISDDCLLPAHRASILQSALDWLTIHRSSLRGQNAHVIISDGTWYGVGSRHAEATALALSEALKIQK
jgi:hypothetical protein